MFEDFIHWTVEERSVYYFLRIHKNEIYGLYLDKFTDKGGYLNLVECIKITQNRYYFEYDKKQVRDSIFTEMIEEIF